VRVSQNGAILYETTVAPGAFELNDLYPTGFGGDLQVSVTEADGSVRVFRVPFTAPVNALREGVTRYSVTGGQYRNPSVHSKPWLAQGTVQHGFSNLITGYGGITAAEGYAAILGGVAINTEWGGFGFDLTQSATVRLSNQSELHGTSARLSYSKLVEPTNTNVSIAAYRYSSSGYLGLQDAMLTRDVDQFAPGLSESVIARQRGRLQLTINQNLPAGWGNFYVAGSMQNYWNRNRSDTQFQAGYNNAYKQFSYGIAASRQLNPVNGKWDNTLMVMLSVPLGTGVHQPISTTSVQRGSSGATNVQEVVSGTLGEDNALSYGINANHSSGDDLPTTTMAGGNVSYESPWARVGASASRSSGATQAGVSASGGVVAYAGGVAFTPSVGATTAIVEAPDAAGARVTNGSGLRVDPWGHAVVSSLTPFSRNQVEIDPKGLPLNVELKSTTAKVAPTSGAVVLLKFETQNAGRSAVLRLNSLDGKPLPFGADVQDMEGMSIGTVAQDGRVILRGLRADRGELIAKWGDAASQMCRVNYALPAVDKSAPASMVIIAAVCAPKVSSDADSLTTKAPASNAQ